LRVTVELALKLAPDTVIEKGFAGLVCTEVLDGVTLEMKGARASTVKGNEFVVWPVSVTAICARPCACREPVGIVAVNCVALTEAGVIVEEVPLMVSTIFESEVKPLPSTVNERKSESPAR